MLKLFATIQKMDEEQRLVFGYASTEALDVQGEVIELEAIKAALPDYMAFANLREMHTMSAVGITKEAQVDDKGLFIAAKVVDEAAWTKVKEGVYKGFSIGGMARRRVGNRIKQLDLTEISLVDRPANPEAIFTCYKADGAKEMKTWKMLAGDEKAMKMLKQLGMMCGMEKSEMDAMDAEKVADAVAAAYDAKEDAGDDEAMKVMDACKTQIADQLDKMCKAAEEAPVEEAKEEKAEEVEADDQAEQEDEASDDSESEDEGEAETQEEGDAEEEDMESEKVEKSAWSLSELASMAQRLGSISMEEAWLADVNQQQPELAERIKALALLCSEISVAMAVKDAAELQARLTPAQPEVVQEEVVEEADPAEKSEKIEDIIKAAVAKAVEEALEKSDKRNRELVEQVNTLQKAANVRFVGKGEPIEKSTLTLAEAKEAGITGRDLLKGMFTGVIR